MAAHILARNFRPQTFSEVVGQDHITETLINAITRDRVAQAYIFAGPRGCGKTTLARILAKALNCERGPTPEPCLVCDNCLAIARGDDVDVQEIDGASNNSVEDIRRLRETVVRSPFRMRYKIYYIDEVHMLSPSAFNALLKTLEEPPAHVKFIFATTEPHKIPPAVVSRCQIHYVKLIGSEDIVRRLKQICEAEEIEIGDDALFAVARAARGGLRDAETLLEMLAGLKAGKGAITAGDVARVTGRLTDDTLAELVDAMQDGDAGRALTITDALFVNGADPKHLLDNLAEYLRAMMMIAAGAEHATGMTVWRHHLKTLARQAARWPLETILAAQKLIGGISRDDLRTAPLTTLPVETALVTLSRIGQLTDLSDLVKRLSATGVPRPAGAPASRASRSPAPAARPRPSAERVASPPPAGTAVRKSVSTGAPSSNASRSGDSSRRMPVSSNAGRSADSTRRLPVSPNGRRSAGSTRRLPARRVVNPDSPLERLRIAVKGQLKQILNAACDATLTDGVLTVSFPVGEEAMAKKCSPNSALFSRLVKTATALFGDGVRLDIQAGVDDDGRHTGSIHATDTLTSGASDAEDATPLFNNLKEYAEQIPAVRDLEKKLGATVMDVQPIRPDTPDDTNDSIEGVDMDSDAAQSGNGMDEIAGDDSG